MKALTKPQRVVFAAVLEAEHKRFGYEPYGADWPSVKRLARDGLIERVGTFTGGYRATQLGREIAAEGTTT